MARTSNGVNVGCAYNKHGNNYVINLIMRGGRKLSNFNRVSNEVFCQAWCEHYESGLAAVAARVGLSVWWTWIRFCLLSVQGVLLPRMASQHREFDISGNEVRSLNRAIRSWLRNS
jgi:hypothetical protein